MQSIHYYHLMYDMTFVTKTCKCSEESRSVYCPLVPVLIYGLFHYAKTWLYHYRGVPKQYFHLYLKEIEFRFNHRNEDIFKILTRMMEDSVPTS
jgi:transposase-like protein